MLKVNNECPRTTLLTDVTDFTSEHGVKNVIDFILGFQWLTLNIFHILL